ncbi:hypothetical protein HK405_013005, partial [Cladochytrium tenue]
VEIFSLGCRSLRDYKAACTSTTRSIYEEGYRSARAIARFIARWEKPPVAGGALAYAAQNHSTLGPRFLGVVAALSAEFGLELKCNTEGSACLLVLLCQQSRLDEAGAAGLLRALLDDRGSSLKLAHVIQAYKHAVVRDSVALVSAVAGFHMPVDLELPAEGHLMAHSAVASGASRLDVGGNGLHDPLARQALLAPVKLDLVAAVLQGRTRVASLLADHNFLTNSNVVPAQPPTAPPEGIDWSALEAFRSIDLPLIVQSHLVWTKVRFDDPDLVQRIARVVKFSFVSLAHIAMHPADIHKRDDPITQRSLHVYFLNSKLPLSPTRDWNDSSDPVSRSLDVLLAHAPPFESSLPLLAVIAARDLALLKRLLSSLTPSTMYHADDAVAFAARTGQPELAAAILGELGERVLTRPDWRDQWYPASAEQLDGFLAAASAFDALTGEDPLEGSAEAYRLAVGKHGVPQFDQAVYDALREAAPSETLI